MASTVEETVDADVVRSQDDVDEITTRPNLRRLSQPRTSADEYYSNRDDSNPVSFHTRDLKNTPRKLNVRAGYNANIHTGEGNQLNNAIFNGPIYFGETGSIVYGNRFLDLTERVVTIDQRERGILKAKGRLENGRMGVQITLLANRYSPYATVHHPKIKRELRRLAKHFEFLDSCFAEYFRSVAPSIGKEYAKELLAISRSEIEKSLSAESDAPEEGETIYLGDLGEFCEAVSKGWDNSGAKVPQFIVRRHSQEEIFHYLQDALEVPYWQFMLKLLAQWRADTNSPSGLIVAHFLNSVKRQLLQGQRQLHRAMDDSGGWEKENIAPIIDGIGIRIKTLEDLCPDTPSNTDDDDFFDLALLDKPKERKTEAAEETHKNTQGSAFQKTTETAILIAMVLGFLIAAIIPGYKAFSISMQTKAAGSIEDADFWYLIQSSIMAVMGNFVMVVPLLGGFWFSPAYWLMWGFLMAGLIFALISVILYPLCNTGWSSLVSFIGTICSAASVLVMTQATASQARQPSKVKQD